MCYPPWCSMVIPTYGWYRLQVGPGKGAIMCHWARPACLGQLRTVSKAVSENKAVAQPKLSCSIMWVKQCHKPPIMPFGNALYNLFIVTLGMVYYCFTHSREVIFNKWISEYLVFKQTNRLHKKMVTTSTKCGQLVAYNDHFSHEGGRNKPTKEKPWTTS